MHIEGDLNEGNLDILSCKKSKILQDSCKKTGILGPFYLHMQDLATCMVLAGAR